MMRSLAMLLLAAMTGGCLTRNAAVELRSGIVDAAKELRLMTPLPPDSARALGEGLRPEIPPITVFDDRAIDALSGVVSDIVSRSLGSDVHREGNGWIGFVSLGLMYGLNQIRKHYLYRARSVCPTESADQNSRQD